MRNPILYILAAVWLSACAPQPEPIAFGTDQCVYCRMTIADPKFGAELVTDKGRVLKYDAIECMIDDLEEDEHAYSMLLAVPFDRPKELIHVDSLHFVYSPLIKSPMGAHLGAFAHLENIPESERSKAIRWSETVEKRPKNE